MPLSLGFARLWVGFRFDRGDDLRPGAGLLRRIVKRGAWQGLCFQLQGFGLKVLGVAEQVRLYLFVEDAGSKIASAKRSVP